MALPSGTVTLVFTDMEGSSDFWERYTHAFLVVLERHNAILRRHAEHWGGFEVKTEGDAFFLAFERASDALAFALGAQRELQKTDWNGLLPGLTELRVRMGIHTGEPILSCHPDGAPDYFGPAVNRSARVSSAAHGGQIIVSDSAHALIRDAAPAEASFLCLGSHRLKGVGSEVLWQACHPDLPSDHPPPRTLDPQRHNLPVQLSSFLGRQRELRQATDLLKTARLLTLTGPGGVGKTRLAVAVAEELLDRFSDGAVFVELEPVADAQLLPSAIARALRVREESGSTVEQSLKEHLRDRQLLLVLDNFEQVLEGATLIRDLLAAAPGLKVLVTSRFVLRITGEIEFQVPPLELPDLARLPPVLALSQYAATQLFIERAVAVKPDFAVTNITAPAVAQICGRLDGLPLAIELAASRIKVLPPDALLARLDQRLRVLTGGARDLPHRQRTLRNTIAWSYELLESGEQQLFDALSVFQGGATLEAVEALCAAQELGVDVLEALASLVDKSFLSQQLTAEGAFRYTMLETLQEFGAERLAEAGKTLAAHGFHAEWFLHLAETAAAKLTGPEQETWLRVLDQERANLQAAFSRAQAQAPLLGLQLAGALWRYWDIRGYYAEGSQWLDAFLAQAPNTPSTARNRALLGAGALAETRGCYDAARQAYKEALAGYRLQADPAGMADALNGQGNLEAGLGNDCAAATAYQEALALHRTLGDQQRAAIVLNNLGSLARERGDYHAAAASLGESLRLKREAGDRRGTANSLNNLGEVLLLQGDHTAAEPLFAEAEVLFVALQDRFGTAMVRVNQAKLLLEQGNLDAADTACRAASEGFLALQYARGQAYCLETLAGISAASGDCLTAAERYGCAERLREEAGARLASDERRGLQAMVAAAAAQCEPTAWSAAWSRGCELAPRTALTVPLLEDSPDTTA